MAHIEPMDVDSISHDFDDKENSLQNSNVLPRTPSTETGYEELDVSELNMKLRYSMTPASSPMSRSLTANFRDNKGCDNGNNSINSSFNDNSNLTRSFNSTITDSTFKSSKFPLQALPTEKYVDDNGNPIVRSLDVECNNVTIKVNGTDNIDDNLSLPSTSSSLVHTPEATTPTKEIVKDGGSPIMRGLKSVLNMFRSSQSPVPPDDITTSDLSSFESHKKEETSKRTTNSVSIPTTMNTNKENVSKTNSPLKESLVFNEDLEKELLWKDEVTILFKEEKIPIHKLFFPLNSATLEKINSKHVEKGNMNTTVEYMDISMNETNIADKTMTETEKLSPYESDTINTESDSEFVDCETSYIKNDTRILDNNILDLSENLNNISSEFAVTDINTFQSNDIVAEGNSLSVVVGSDLPNETHPKEVDIDDNCKQTINHDLPTMRKSLDEINFLSSSLKENVPNLATSDKSNTSFYEIVHHVHCSNETFNLEKSLETIDKEHKDQNDIVKTSAILGNDASLGEEGDEDHPSQMIDEHELDNNTSKGLVCSLDSTIVLKESILNQTDASEVNNITLPVKYQVVNDVEINSDVVEDEIKITDNTEVPLDKCGEMLNIGNNCTNKLDTKLIEDTILKQKHNSEAGIFIFPDQSIQLEDREFNNVNNNLPSDIPLPYDSDIDKDIIIQDINEENVRENDKSVNISFNNLNLDVSNSVQSIEHTIDGITPLTERHVETNNIQTINPIIADTSIIQKPVTISEDISNIKDDMTVNENSILKIQINNSVKCTPTAKDGKSEFPLNNNSVSRFDVNIPKHHTQDIQNLSLQNHDECVQTGKSTITNDKNEIDVKNQNDNYVSFSSTTNKTLVHEIELDVSKQDSEDGENTFEIKNNITASLELQHYDSFTADVILQDNVESMPIIVDDKNYVLQTTNNTDVQVKHDEVDIPTVNINTSVIGMDVDVSEHDSGSSANVIESKNIFTPIEITDSDSNIDNTDVIKTDVTESVPTIINDNNEIKTKTGVKINETVNLSLIHNALVTDMELNVPDCDLEDSVNQIEIKEPEPEIAVSENIIRSVDAKTYLEEIPLDYNNKLRKENDLKKHEEISITLNSNESVTEMELDVSKDYLIGSENKMEASHPEGDIEDMEVAKNDFVSINKLQVDKVEIASDITISDELIFPISKDDDENIENTFETKGLISSSPPISSKFTQNGYSINFEEIDDPFTTKTNIRMSPTSDIIKNDSYTNSRKNKTEFQKKPQLKRRITLHEQKKSNVLKERANASFDCVLNNVVNKCEESLRIQEISVRDSENHDNIEKNMNSVSSTIDILPGDLKNNIPRSSTVLGHPEDIVEDEDINLCNKINSSLSEIYKSKNVFNLPEIDDVNFNPFATKLNICQSPTKESEHISYDNYKINDNQRTSPDVCHNSLDQTTPTKSGGIDAEKDNFQILEPNLSTILSNLTCSSKNADDTASGEEVRTEDEDTVEGPFLEAEDFADIVKVSDFRNEKDMMNFEDLPTQTNEENKNGEFFIDAEAFEFLLNQNKSNVVADSGKESLFLKFDPLFAKRVSSDGVLAALSKIQKRQSTPKKQTPLKIMVKEKSPTPGPSSKATIGIAAPVASNVVEEPVAAIGKPMMVVNPAVASIVSTRKSITPPRINRRSLTFTSPAMAVIDRLLSLSGNSSGLAQDSSLPPSREYNETDFALTQLRELLADKEIHVHNLRSESKELKEKLSILESQVRTLEIEGEKRLCKVNELNEHLTEKNKINKSMAVVVEEYERTIASLISDMEQEKKQNAEERMKLISERDEQTAHLASMEVSFSDLHSKYEKSKQIILSMKANEDTYKKSLNEFEVNILKIQTNYDLLKQHATSKLNHANQELEKYNRAHDAEVLKLNAMIKRKELHITSLEESLSQKTKANEELTAICDELINKVG